MAARKQTTVSNLALAWLLAQPGVDSVIPGGKRLEQVAENAKACELNLDRDELNEIERIMG